VSVRAEWIVEPARLAEIGGPWDRLAAADPAPFSYQAWLVPWWRAFGGRRELRVCTVWEGAELIAALPLRCDGGRRLRATTNDHTPAYRPLTRGAAARATLATALVAVGDTRRSPCSPHARGGADLILGALPAEEPETRALLDAVSARGTRTVSEAAYVSPIADTSGTFETYRAQHKSRWRELERRGRKMAREHELETAAVAVPADLERELTEGLELEAAGWKGRQRTAILCEPDTAAFYRDMARAFHERGDLRLSSLRVDGRLVAFDLALLHRERYFLLKTAYDEGLRTLAPGLVLRRAVVERCFELGLEAHEFLGIEMEWKRLFATEGRRHFVWRAYPRGTRGALRYGYRRRARPWLRAAFRSARRRA
jgi:CelD/BcsL family acetyltransferase involved in cellulose biosynthesis